MATNNQPAFDMECVRLAGAFGSKRVYPTRKRRQAGRTPYASRV